MYGDDMVGTKTGKEMRMSQPTTMAPIPGATILPYSNLLIAILFLSLCSYTHVHFCFSFLLNISCPAAFLILRTSHIG